MYRRRSSHGVLAACGFAVLADGKTRSRKPPTRTITARAGKTLVMRGRIGLAAVLAVVFLFGLAGCSSSSKSAVTSDPQAKVRLEKLLKFYQMYTSQKKKPPPNEQAFKDFIRSLPQDEKEAAGVGEDVDSFLVSPRDGQKYRFQYGMAARPDGPNRAVAWEETGQDGMRYVALTIGYVQQCNEEMFQSYKKK
jgi:hypothetical protein